MPETAAAPGSAPALTLNDMLCFAVYSANNAFNRFYKPLLAETGLTYPQFLVLMALWETDGQSVGRLGDRLGLESNTLTPLLKRMEAAGLLERRRSATDERQVLALLTPRGRSIQTEIGPAIACVFEASGLDVDEVVALKADIDRIRDRLEAARPA